MMEDIKKQLDDIFDIPKDGSNLDGASISNDEINNGIAFSFSEKVKDVKERILEEEEVGDKNIYLDDMNKGNIANEEKQSVDKLSSIIEKSVSNKKDEQESNSEMEESFLSKRKDKESDDEEKEISKDETFIQNDDININLDSTKWMLSTKNLVFKSFYEEKKKILPILLIGGELPCSFMENELIQARIDMKSISIYDYEALSKKMYLIQEWRNRVTEIQLRVSKQYFIWKRFIDLLKGKLLYIEQAKPYAKQEGINYAHLRDFEYYYERLQSLYENSKAVTKNLDAAFECCSRVVTLSMPQKQVQRNESNNISNSFDKNLNISINSGKYNDFDGIFDNERKNDKISVNEEERKDKTTIKDVWDLL